MHPNSVIIYYSWVGNTEIAAKELQKSTGYDLIKIEEKKDRKFGNVMGSAMGAMFGLKSGIKPIDYSLQNYTNVYLGAQVWAGKTTPAINRFLSKANFKGKNVWLFITKSDEKVPNKVIDSIKARIEKKGGKVMETLSITTKWDPKTNIPITVEEIRASVITWAENIQKGKS